MQKTPSTGNDESPQGIRWRSTRIRQYPGSPVSDNEEGFPLIVVAGSPGETKHYTFLKDLVDPAIMRWLFPLVLLVLVIVAVAGCLAPGGTTTPSAAAPVPTTVGSVPAQTLVSQTTPAHPTGVLVTQTYRPDRPKTGSLVSGRNLDNGYGALEVDNTAGSGDAVVVLTRSGSKTPLMAFYLRKGEVFHNSGIGDGTYDLYFILGEGWDPGAKEFTSGQRFQKFEDPLVYETIGNQYTEYTVTLYGVSDGNAETDTVSEENFPDL